MQSILDVDVVPKNRLDIAQGQLRPRGKRNQRGGERECRAREKRRRIKISSVRIIEKASYKRKSREKASDKRKSRKKASDRRKKGEKA